MAKATRQENIDKARRLKEDRWQESEEIAQSNYEQRKMRSNGQQLKVLDRRLGIAQGAKKERLKLGDSRVKA